MKKEVLLFALGFFLNSFAAAQNSEPAAAPEITGTESNSNFLTDSHFSFFGTAGYAISDQPFAYNKISNHGTFDSLSRLGVQADFQFTPRWGLTLQGGLTPALNDDKRWRPRLTWAFLSYRPTNSWLLRLGRIRLPALLYTQNASVEMSYVPARLPVEVYNLSLNLEYNGLSSTYTWDVGEGGLKTLTWDAYAGVSNFYQRIWMRDSYDAALGNIRQGANYYARKMRAVGTFLTYQDVEESNILRFGVHYVLVKDRNGNTFMKNTNKQRYPIMNPLNPLVPVGTVDFYLPVGGERSDNVKFLLFDILGDWHLGNGFYFTGEVGVRRATNMITGLNTRAFYLQLRKRIDRFTPYISFAHSKSDSKSRAAYNDMSRSTGFAALDMLNRISADAMLMANQSTFAIGTAIDFGNHHRVKLEYARVRIGRGAALVDARLEDGDLDGKGINIFTASYNFLF